VSTRLYVEGGGDSKDLRSKCREGFRKFLEKAGLAGRMPRIVACGGRRNAYDSFCTAVASGNQGTPMLLVDAEGPVASGDPWQHLQARDGWARPQGAMDDQCHLMVQVMEAWFLADRNALRGFFGQGFHEGSLPADPQMEAIAKDEVLAGLKDAAHGTNKGGYQKGKHSFAILGGTNPRLVEAVAPYAKRFLDTLRA